MAWSPPRNSGSPRSHHPRSVQNGRHGEKAQFLCAAFNMINRAEPRACGHSREPIPPDSEPEAERNAGSASNAAGDGGGRARSDQAGFQPYWGKPAVRNDKRGWRKRGQDLMAICHDARKGRNKGSPWSKPVAPPLYSTSSASQVRRLRVFLGFGSSEPFATTPIREIVFLA